MDTDSFPVSETLQKDLMFLGVTLLVAASGMAAGNLMTPDEPTEVGTIKVETRCVGIDVGVCLGIQRRSHTTYNYDDWENPEPGTENFYRLVESELMVRAYNTCEEGMEGMEWTSEVSYRNKTAAEWLQNENIQLLPCEKTFWRELEG